MTTIFHICLLIILIVITISIVWFFIMFSIHQAEDVAHSIKEHSDNKKKDDFDRKTLDEAIRFCELRSCKSDTDEFRYQSYKQLYRWLFELREFKDAQEKRCKFYR